MRIISLIAVIVIIGVIAALGTRMVLTGSVISNPSDSSVLNESNNYSDNPEDNASINKTSINENSSSNTSSESNSGGGGGGGSSGVGASKPKEICDGKDNDGNGLIDDGNLCNDENELTIDKCSLVITGYNETNDENIYGKECTNIIPNFYGQTYDADNGSAIQGVNISIYNSSEYDAYNDTGNYSALVPKQSPDIVTDENGTYAIFIDPDESYNIVFQHSDEKEFNINLSSRDTLNKSIILPKKGYIKVYFEKASAALKSDLYIDFENGSSQLLVEKSNVGQVVYLNNTNYSEGEEIKFHIRVNGSVWSRLKNHGYSYYNHSSDSKYCQVERLDLDTWRLHFEDLPDWWPPDWDFNDAVVLVDIINSTGNSNQSINNSDCDDDGIVNWLDNNDSSCDFGEEDVEINESINQSEIEKINAEGHILFYGKYGRENKYVCGDKLKFMMFGINKGNQDENLTFLIEDHTQNPGVNGVWVYNGSLSKDNESLVLPKNGTKVHKTFEFEIPCSFNEGKQDIHIIWKGKKFHKIGNFFVVKDTTPPWINLNQSVFGLPNENISIWYSAGDTIQDDTVRATEFGILEGPDDTLEVVIDKDISEDSDNDSVFDNDVDYYTTGGTSLYAYLNYSHSGNYTARFTVKDKSNNTASKDVNVTVFITEEEAQEIAYPLYVEFGVASLFFENNSDVEIDNQTINIDRWNDFYLIGDEYLTPGNDLESLNISSMNQNIDDCSKGQELIKPIFPTTAENFNNILWNYLIHLRDVCKYI